jgi:hypothetical protein
MIFIKKPKKPDVKPKPPPLQPGHLPKPVPRYRNKSIDIQEDPETNDIDWDD